MVVLASCSKDEGCNGTNNENSDGNKNNALKQEAEPGFKISTTGNADLNLKGNRAVFQALDDIPT